MSTIQIIFDLLEEHPGMTVAAISEEIGITEKGVSCAIWRARKDGLPIRVCGALTTHNHPFLYEISDKPDVKVLKKGSSGPAQKRGRPVVNDPEEYMASRKASLAALVQPFRDPMLFLTAGVAP